MIRTLLFVLFCLGALVLAAAGCHVTMLYHSTLNDRHDIQGTNRVTRIDLAPY